MLLSSFTFGSTFSSPSHIHSMPKPKCLSGPFHSSQISNSNPILRPSFSSSSSNITFSTRLMSPGKEGPDILHSTSTSLIGGTTGNISRQLAFSYNSALTNSFREVGKLGGTSNSFPLGTGWIYPQWNWQNKQWVEFGTAFLSWHLVPAQEQQVLGYSRSRYNVVKLPVHTTCFA